MMNDASSWALIEQLLLALAIGLLIGVERGWETRDQPENSRVAGFRTFGLLGLGGGVAGLLTSGGHSVPATILLVAALTALLAGYIRVMLTRGDVSVTSYIAAILTIGLGLLATSGYAIPAGAAAATVMLILALRQQLHGWVTELSDVDMQATARFAVITAVILPLLPDRSFGPYGAWNPRTLWLIVVLVSGISFIGYAANKIYGSKKGTIATAAIGGLYSSTAVSIVLARRLKESPASESIVTAGISIASALSFVRGFILAAVLSPYALPTFALSIGPATLVQIAIAAWLLRGEQTEPLAVEGETSSPNPLELRSALSFAAMVAIITLATRWARSEFGSAGAAVLIAIGGAFNTNLGFVTLASLPRDAIEARMAGYVLAVPIFVNTLVKVGLVISSAGRQAGWRAVKPLMWSAATIVVTMAILLLHDYGARL